MKKILLFLMILTFAFSLASCGEDAEVEGGEDTVCEGNDGGEHSYGNPEIEYNDQSIKMTYTCVNCGHVKTVTQKIDSKVEDTVEWDQLFEGFILTNFTLEVKQGNEVAVVIITENAVYYNVPRYIEYYAVRNEDGSCVAYVNYTNNQFIKISDGAEQLLISAQKEAVLNISFAENFDKFTYDTASASYKSSSTITAQYFDPDGTPDGELYCINSVVNVVDGRISYIESDFYYDEDDLEKNNIEHFEYFNIGDSVVVIPQDVIEGAQPGSYEDVFGK